MVKEEWKNVIGYEDFYQISNFGNIKSLRSNKILKPALSSGYKCVSLCGQFQSTKRIHRLVAKHFLEKTNLNYVNHIDGNKLNNHYLNLEWCTPKQNYDHSVANNLQGYANKAISQFTLEGKHIRDFISAKEAENITKICRKQISNCLKKKQKTCKGFIWEYKNLI